MLQLLGTIKSPIGMEMSDKQQVKFHCIAFAFVFTESQDNLAWPGSKQSALQWNLNLSKQKCVDWLNSCVNEGCILFLTQKKKKQNVFPCKKVNRILQRPPELLKLYYTLGLLQICFCV